MPKPDARGFTLLELTVVLVIIGLLAGGVLFGRDLLIAAGRRHFISELDKYTTAVRLFRVKYNCIPGDCKNAVAYNLGTGGGAGDNGDGDGMVYSTDDGGLGMTGGGWVRQKEGLNFWYHLSQAKLTAFPAKGYNATQPASIASYVPELKLDGRVFVFAYSIVQTDPLRNMGNAYYLSSDLQGNNYGNSMSAVDAYYFDTKLDDGLPFSGNVRTFYPFVNISINNGGNYGCALININQYDTAGLWQYNASAAVAQTPPNPNSIDCGLVIGNELGW